MIHSNPYSFAHSQIKNRKKFVARNYVFAFAFVEFHIATTRKYATKNVLAIEMRIRRVLFVCVCKNHMEYEISTKRE